MAIVGSLSIRFSSRRTPETGGGQNLERSIFRNFKMANIKMTKGELFDNFIFEYIFHFLEII